MNRLRFLQRFLRMSPVLACLLGCHPAPVSHGTQQAQGDGETIVLLRHGEKPAGGLGQLTCMGLNRALALPSMLIGRYGKPDFIYAPNPAAQVKDGITQSPFSYVRPLATIEPTAIRLGMPVNAQIGYEQIGELQRTLLQPAYAHSLVFVVWEHVMLYDFARQMLQSYGTNPEQVPEWANNDYDSIYVFHITRSGNDATPRATLEIHKEDLTNTLKDTCPGPQ